MKSILAIILTAMAASPLFGAVVRNIPDKDGMTIKGVVYCGDEPVQGAQVSDGVNVTRTDENGWYYLASAKECGHVFVCNPKGYKYPRKAKYPEFYKTVDTERPSAVEQADFELERDEATDHTILFLADIQMCGRNEDIRQYEEHAVGDINTSISNARKQGKDVYVITLGDQSYNTYWHSYNIGIPEIHESMNLLDPDAIFNCMGNHDNNPKIAGDWAASADYREQWGPTYYSFNIGEIHYVVLDNIEFTNAECKNTFECNITTSVIKWLRKDLANVSKDTPIVVCMHAPLFYRPQCSKPNVPDPTKYRYNYGSQFYNSVKGFKDVRVFTGHAHTNYTVSYLNMTEYNVGAIGGNLWWTGYFVNGNSVCTDGSPGGYRVLDTSGKELKTYYKCIGFDNGYQFRCYDLNNCHITASRFAPSYKNPADIDTWLANGYGFDSSDYNSDGTPKIPNRVLINVFAYDTNWKVEVLEDGKPLEVSRISGYDPFSMISDGCQRFEKTGHNNSGNPTQNSHLFLVTAKYATSPLSIKVTDQYGSVYTQVMERPKGFSIDRYTPQNEQSAIFDIDSDSYSYPPEFYNINGIKVSRPEKGLYVMRLGTKTKKVFIR
ncbi:metallophosphoesterase [Muribaculaceae bacterium Isolate-001 (NCI)]|nr:metallophosphoesterase [Muribaculaceae bacterium Isolate-001 (NCI)]